MPSLQDELQKALHKERERFQAMALVELGSDRLLFLETTDSAPKGMSEALEAFLLRLVTDTEGHDQLGNREIIFYDIDERQIVSYLVQKKKRRCVLVLVVSPRKTYKQVAKRLIKSLKTLL